jgi:hypothetical protein
MWPGYVCLLINQDTQEKRVELSITELGIHMETITMLSVISTRDDDAYCTHVCCPPAHTNYFKEGQAGFIETGVTALHTALFRIFISILKSGYSYIRQKKKLSSPIGLAVTVRIFNTSLEQRPSVGTIQFNGFLVRNHPITAVIISKFMGVSCVCNCYTGKFKPPSSPILSGRTTSTYD